MWRAGWRALDRGGGQEAQVGIRQVLPATVFHMAAPPRGAGVAWTDWQEATAGCGPPLKLAEKCATARERRVGEPHSPIDRKRNR